MARGHSIIFGKEFGRYIISSIGIQHHGIKSPCVQLGLLYTKTFPYKKKSDNTPPVINYG
jgi:hypothetical protein